MKSFYIFSFVIALFAYSCKQTEPKKEEQKETFKSIEEDNPYTSTASQWGNKNPETFVFLHSPAGLRIEYNLDRQLLQLWINPLAGTSLNYRDRNFSNRDDHTDIFNKISLPNLNLSDYDHCDYDAFHSKIYFKNGQVLHIVPHYDHPAVILWFEKDDMVDLKASSSSILAHSDPYFFSVTEPTRGRAFTYCAAIGKGNGQFQHQLEIDKERSIYARANLKANQTLVIAGELSQENVSVWTKEIASLPINNLLTENESKISADLQTGKIVVKNNPDLQKLIDVNKRYALSVQDKKGLMRSAVQYIYYLLWLRDNGMNVNHFAYSGWAGPVQKSTPVLLANPNTTKTNPTAKFYGQLLSGPITKWEEDGAFYAIWSAFTEWTQTGNTEFVSGENLKTLEASMSWLEDYCYDEKQGLFGRYYYCETPLQNSRDEGWDNANGSPSPKWPAIYDKDSIVRAYDLYINLLNYSNYAMLATMTTGEKAKKYWGKAQILEKNIAAFFGKEALPSYGKLLTNTGKYKMAVPYGMDQTDYVWSMSLPPFFPSYDTQFEAARLDLYKNLRNKPAGYFFAGYCSILRNMDTELYSEDSIMNAITYLIPQSVRAGKYLTMPYAMPEIVDVKDGNPFHDVRPITFSIGPFTAALSNLGVRRLPFGLAVRNTKYLSKIEKYDYQGSLINFEFIGGNSPTKVLVNNIPLKYTLQIPEKVLTRNTTVSISGITKGVGPILISSTVKLVEVLEKGNTIIYTINAKGPNQLVFLNNTKDPIVTNPSGRNIPSQITKSTKATYLRFEGIGNFYITLIK